MLNNSYLFGVRWGGREQGWWFLVVIHSLLYCLNILHPRINFIIKNCDLKLTMLKSIDGKSKGISREEGTGGTVTKEQKKE